MVEIVARAGLRGYTGPGIVVRDHFRLRPGQPGRVAAGLGPVVVLAETAIDVGAGFPMHGHAGVEIVSYVCRGRLAHEDTMGNGATLAAGDVQVMRCGTGVRHSEVNGGGEPVRMYQLWLAARRPDVSPGYVDLPAPIAGADPVVLASGRAGDAPRVPIDVDAAVIGAAVAGGGSLRHDLSRGRAAYVVAAEGAARVDGVALGEGDAALRTDPGPMEIAAEGGPARVLLLDVAADGAR